MVLALTLAALMSQDPKITFPAQTVTNIEGQEIVLPDPKSKATVFLFVAVDCPISNRYAPELGRMYKDFSKQGVSFVRVYVDDSVETKDMLQHGKDFKLPSEAVLDGKHAMVKKLGMTVTPEVAVVAPDGTVKYRGRINDLYAEHGRIHEGDVRQDLRVALEEVLAGKPVSVPFTTAIGCGIPDG